MGGVGWKGAEATTGNLHKSQEKNVSLGLLDHKMRSIEC
jgi:hypothetical protein